MFFEEENTYVRIDKYGKKILSSQGGSYTKPVVGSSELVSKLSIKLIMQRGIKLLDIRIQYEYTKATYTSQSFSGRFILCIIFGILSICILYNVFM